MNVERLDNTDVAILLAVITEENLPVNLYHTHQLREYEVVLEENQGQYIVYATNERAGKQGIDSVFNSEQDALGDVILKSHILKKRYHN